MRPPGGSSIALAFLVSMLSAMQVSAEISSEISVEPYAGLQGGVFLWPAYSNRDEVEADTGPGFSWAVVGGLDLRAAPRDDASVRLWTRLLRRFSGRVELEVGQRFADIHGINDGPLQLTGDGKTLQATTAHVNLWPAVKVASGVRIYAGGGGGGTWLRGLGSDKRVWSGQAGLGLLFDLPLEGCSMRLDVGWRSFFANSTKLRGALADFDAHGGVLGVQVAF